MMVLTPLLLLPSDQGHVTEGMVLIALFAAFFVLFEYGSTYPGLVEFRAAPPFNRVRFGILFGTLLLVAVACRAHVEPTALSRLVAAVGYILGQSMDFAFGPIRLIMWMLPEGTTMQEAALVRTAAGLAYLVGLVGLTIFAILIRLQSWPSPTGAFNVWVNLPTFDPTAGRDVVKRLKRDGALNILLGLAMPYLTTPLAWFVGGSFGLSILESDLLLVWTMAIWAFLPVSMFLRGIAMRRLALMISSKRRRLVAEDAAGDPAFLPA